MTPTEGTPNEPREIITRFLVHDVPAPGGSKRAFRHWRTGKMVVVDDAKHNREWRASVAAAGIQAYRGKPVTCALVVEMTFTLLRPKSHFVNPRSRDRLRASAALLPTGRPDLLKLGRSTEDALTGIVWRDDAQIVAEKMTKRYGPNPGAEIAVYREE